MAITRTTLSAAITKDDLQIGLASTTGMLAKDLLVIGEEVIQVNSIPVAGQVLVQRGMAGTSSQAHSSAEAADFGQTSDFGAFGAREVDGSKRGAGLQNRGAKLYEAAGAISIQAGLHVLDGSGTAFTLADPTEEDVGKELLIHANDTLTAFVVTATALRGESPTDDTTITWGTTNVGGHCRLVVLPDLVYGVLDNTGVTIA